MLNTAIKAARKAGSIINRASMDLDLIRVSSKGRSDFVTEVDKAAEQAILEIVSKAYPDHAILAEESGASGKSEYTWIIDPLDGTTNFIHGFPQYAVSIALRHREHVTQAVVYDPTRNELFTATRGRGAFMNERRLRVSKRERLADCLIGTGFPFRSLEFLDEYVRMFKSITETTAGVRRPGAAALDLAYVAAGPARRLLGDRIVTMGHGGRQPVDPRSRWTRLQFRRRARLYGRRPYRLRVAEGFPAAAETGRRRTSPVRETAVALTGRA